MDDRRAVSKVRKMSYLPQKKGFSLPNKLKIFSRLDQKVYQVSSVHQECFRHIANKIRHIIHMYDINYSIINSGKIAAHSQGCKMSITTGLHSWAVEL